MKEYKNVIGSQLSEPSQIEVNVDTVYVRSNIVKIDTEEFAGWQYDEIQYDKNEYISNIFKLESDNNKLKQENELLNMSVMELSNYAAEQDTKIQTQEDAIMELSMFIMGGN